MKSRNECCNLSIGLYIALAPLSLNYAGKLQEKRFDFIKTLANIISENLVEVSKIKYFKPNQQTLNRLKENYDYIIIDCMPSLNMITINALVASDEVIIPLHTQYFSVRGLEQLLQTIGSIISDLNSSLKIAGILYTCVNDQTNQFKGIQGILSEAYGKDIKIYENYIPRSVKAEEAPSYGKSIYAYDTKGRVYAAYRDFTQEFLQSEREGF